MSKYFSPIKFQITDGLGHNMSKCTITPDGAVEATHASISLMLV